MNKIIFLLALIIGASNLYPDSKINSYDIIAKYNKAENKITVSAELEIQKENPGDTLLLLFNSNCKINSLKNTKSETDVKYFTGGKDSIFLILDANSLPFSITFNYEYPVGKDTVILLDRGYRWYPLIAENVETFKMAIEVPQDFIGLTAGELTDEKQNAGTKTFCFESKQNVFKIPVIIAPEDYYNVKEYDCSGIKLFFYSISDENEKPPDSINIDICNLISYFNKTIGEYRFKRFSLVETSAFQGSNLGSSIITAGSDNINYYKSGYKDWLYMDVASQWVCTGIFPKLFCKGFWFMSVSFPHYLRLMYIRDTQGEEIFENTIDKLKSEYLKIAGSENEVPILDVDYPNSKEKGLALYAKGVVVLNILENELGRENWVKFLRYFYKEYNEKTVILDTLTETINKFDLTGSCSKHLLKMLNGKGMPE